ncbi:TRAP transporter small permease [Pseudoroseomonas cervicalis]|uniref:TRAP transporter small permease protein n=1 Tax=Pseudoroseomonas cervicalis ATCC 49957 TaxID=525371 RepID=D5RIF7_9PROT|nr:TRAP transporter small permease [Pseudoroseomonas cervicalis]EFH12914.1 TRAP transporter, DctQ-like membrane protein [Pseudoroseomonas cervicalis ATCC 49957]
MRKLRAALDVLYLLGGIGGALSLALIALVIAAQVGGRFLGHAVAGADDLTAFAVAASALLPLAYAFRHGAHIRVDLVLGRLSGAPRRVMEALALLLAALITAAFAWSLLDLAADSLEFDDVAQGSVAWKLWPPQALCGLGAALFALALLDDLVVHLAGGTPSYRRHEEKSAMDRAAEEL